MPVNNKRNLRRGTAAVEFAVAAPILLLTIFVLIEVSRVVMVQHALTTAARAGARRATLATTQQRSDVEAYIRDHLQSQLRDATDPQKVKVTVTPQSFSNVVAGTPATVAISVRFSDATWLPTSWLVGDIEMTAQARKIRE